MDWQGGRRGDVEDRRGGGGLIPIAGGGVVLTVLALIGYFVFGIDPSTVMNAGNQLQGQSPTAQQGAATGTCPQGDEACDFSNVIHTSANDTWQSLFDAAGKPYHPSTIVLYSQGTQTGCGLGQSAMGPFYCPADERVYLDLDFFHTMDTELGAKGDFAKAYVIAHEVGHHVQNLLGTSAAIQRQEQGLSESGANALSVKLELQADCYAGVWAKDSNQKQHWIQAGDIDEALGAANAVGDDTLQRKAQGRVVPDSFTHGSAAQRVQWFKTGFTSGDPASCDTFRS
ncbi:neutral zinc metallopeptidase [Asticcacaulis sp. 201]|uniref:KPN_02809 family neutral zinc metallopeptidase n=1 Tax=Asticcacaulis sp. 201 TaxID=3028787 RepID=UPI002916202D|nr:neutral zinc metallopeptidase [Asticcacaulis sp. 201]MDV6333028.1 neutral zinc metallopeptidase [Asticcacaulis sp. 201]